jgi:hypothetical protein
MAKKDKLTITIEPAKPAPKKKASGITMPNACPDCGHTLVDHMSTGNGSKKHVVCMNFGCRCGEGSYLKDKSAVAS